jgi:hypothetical protein
LTQSAGHQLGYANMVGNIPTLTTPVVNTGSSAVTVAGEVLYIPLEFWFNRNPGLALPLIALNIAGQKSIQPCASELCARETMLRSQGLCDQSQMLVMGY